MFVEVVIPGEVQQWLVFRIGRSGIQLLEALAEVVDEPRVGAAIAERVEGLVLLASVGPGCLTWADWMLAAPVSSVTAEPPWIASDAVAETAMPVGA